MLKLENRKAGMPMSITLLVVLTMILLVFSLYIFAIREKSFQRTITPPEELDLIYADSEVLDFYLDAIVSDLKDRSNVIESFRKAFLEYKIKRFKGGVSEAAYTVLYAVIKRPSNCLAGNQFILWMKD